VTVHFMIGIEEGEYSQMMATDGEGEELMEIGMRAIGRDKKGETRKLGAHGTTGGVEIMSTLAMTMAETGTVGT
jgi:hypothetical protein